VHLPKQARACGLLHGKRFALADQTMRLYKRTASVVLLAAMLTLLIDMAPCILKRHASNASFVGLCVSSQLAKSVTEILTNKPAGRRRWRPTS